MRVTRDVVEDGDRRAPDGNGAPSDEAGTAEGEGQPLRPIDVLGCPAQDEMDELALVMLARLADRTRVAVEVVPSKTMSLEFLSLVEAKRPAAVCIMALPSGGMTPARYLCRRLRRRFPALRIVVGRCGQVEEGRDRDRTALTAAGADSVEFTIAGLRAALEDLAAPPVPGRPVAL